MKECRGLLENLDVKQLYSLDIIIKTVSITHGPHKNTGDIDNWTESEEDEEMTPPHATDINDREMTVGLALVENKTFTSPVDKSRTKDRQKTKSRNADRRLSTRAPYVQDTQPPYIQDTQPFYIQDTQPSYIQDTQPSYIQDTQPPCLLPTTDELLSLMNRSRHIKKSLTIARVQTDRVKEEKSLKSKHRLKQTKRQKAKTTAEKTRAWVDETKSLKEAVESPNTTTERADDARYKRRKGASGPELPKGCLLPPLRATVSFLHIRDIVIPQVDLDKLYPPGEDVTYPDDTSPKSSSHVNSSKNKPFRDDVKEINKKTEEKASKPQISIEGAKIGGGRSETKPTRISNSNSKLPPDSEKSPVAGRPGKNANKNETPVEEHELKFSNYTKRTEAIKSLRRVCDFNRGVSFVFTSTPLEMIRRLQVEKLEVEVARSANRGPVYPVGKVKIQLPKLFKERLLLGVRPTTTETTWTCLEDSFPIVNHKGREVGHTAARVCLSSLGNCMASPSLVSDSNLFDYKNRALHVGLAHFPCAHPHPVHR